MRPTIVINVVGLTPALLGPHAPNLQRLATSGGMRSLETVTPAVTTSVQATLVTGTLPQQHGIVANGWYFRDLAEILFWRQSNHLVSGEKLWEAARRIDPNFTCAKLFWWYNMYSSVDYSVTPRPMYPADGRKIPDIYTNPAALRDELAAKLGQFPLFHFWGPAADITSSEWITQCSLQVIRQFTPTLSLVYLPHLDYNLQRLSPNDPRIVEDVAAVDGLCGELIDCASQLGAEVIVLSEYGVTPVHRPIHINRVLRARGYLRIRQELGHELLDAGASQAFAVADHQIAHIYVSRPESIPKVKELVESIPGIDKVLDAATKSDFGLDHPRSGELVALAKPDSWFTYYFFLDESLAPDFARTVDIHRKPGFDPAELFIDPKLLFPKLHVARRVMQKMLGLRYLMDVIPLDATLVKGSHGRLTERPEHGPLLITSRPALLPPGSVSATEVKRLILDHMFVP